MKQWKRFWGKSIFSTICRDLYQLKGVFEENRETGETMKAEIFILMLFWHLPLAWLPALWMGWRLGFEKSILKSKNWIGLKNLHEPIFSMISDIWYSIWYPIWYCFDGATVFIRIRYWLPHKCINSIIYLLRYHYLIHYISDIISRYWYPIRPNLILYWWGDCPY